MNPDSSARPQSPQERLPFLLEIGSEEIPARFIPGAMADLERLFRAELDQANLTAVEMRVLATPRRMALLCGGLDVRQPDRDLTIKGPPVSVAFDEQGQPTPAALGFARKAGVDLAECERGEDKRGEFLVARTREIGQSASEVLAGILPRIILGIPFRKKMRWGDGDLEYPRPLQWIVALLGQDVVPVSVGDIESGRESRGHRTLASNRTVEIIAPENYVEALSAAGVMVDHQERRRVIEDGLVRELATCDQDARLLPDDELLTEVVFLCEHPTPFIGSYSDEYAELPAPVVTTALKAHQRYFSVGTTTGEGLRPRFAAVRDGGTDHLDWVIQGNERVLHARLADAFFYWNFDQKKTPDERAAMLSSVTWLEGFGSMLDKTARLEHLVDWLWRNGLGDGGETPAALVRAAHLSKSDLVSEMIRDGKEFTKLEGFIGARYAARAGEPQPVCDAIEGHYLPRSATGELPGDAYSAVLSVADRLDNIAGCWLAGFVPTGAKDPYALRRHALAVLRILVDGQKHLDLAAAVGVALEGLADFRPQTVREEAAEAIAEFIRIRLAGFLVESRGANPEVVRAVLPARWRDPADALAWVEALDGYREQDDFQLLATGFKRCRNILKGDELAVADLADCRARWLAGGAGAGAEDFSTLPEAREQDLLDKVAASVPSLVRAEEDKDYHQVFAVLSRLGPAIDAFFEEVRVNADDAELRRLRHAFLREIHALFAQYADFAAVVAAEV